MRVSRGPRPNRRCAASLDSLEGRLLLSSTSHSTAYRVARAQHKYHEYVGELQHVELQSRATPAEALALRDVARSISAAAATTDLPRPVARRKAVVATLQLDHAPLHGVLEERGWAEVRTRLASTLDGLNVPPDLIDRAVAAMRAIARSARVTTDEFATLSAKEASYRNARNALPNGSANLPDPEVYYTQHLRGFFRGGAVEHRQAQAMLESHISAIIASTHGTPAAEEVLRRDARLLEQLGATVDSQANARLGDTFVAAFDQGIPDEGQRSELRAALLAILGPGATRRTFSAVDRLVADTHPSSWPRARLRSPFARSLTTSSRW